MHTDERTNQALVSALEVSNSQPSVPANQALISVISACNFQPSSTALVVRPPDPVAATIAVNYPPQDTIATAAQAYSATNVKLQSILKRRDSPSIPDEGSCVESSLMINAHISEVILTPASDVEKSINDPRRS